MVKCQYPGCQRHAQYLMGWNNENGKHFGLVCSTCDRELGRMNLVRYIPLSEAIDFERYLKETVDLESYLDFPEWMGQEGKAYTQPTYRGSTPYNGSASVELLDLSPRSWNALRRHGITTIGELANTNPDELRNIRNLGIRSIREIQQKLREFVDA